MLMGLVVLHRRWLMGIGLLCWIGLLMVLSLGPCPQSSEGVEFSYNGPAWAKEDTLAKLLGISTRMARDIAKSDKEVTTFLKEELKVQKAQQKKAEQAATFQKELADIQKQRAANARAAEARSANFYDRLVDINNKMSDAVQGLDFDASMSRMEGILGEPVRGGIATTVKNSLMKPLDFALQTTGTMFGVLQDAGGLLFSGLKAVSGMLLTGFTTALGLTIGRLQAYSQSFNQLPSSYHGYFEEVD